MANLQPSNLPIQVAQPEQKSINMQNQPQMMQMFPQNAIQFRGM